MLSINTEDLIMDSSENSSSNDRTATISSSEPSKEACDQQGGRTVQVIQYQGFWHTPAAAEKIKSLEDDFVARPGDIVLCTFPKTGTTWLKSLTFAITTRSQYNTKQQQSPLLTEFPHHCIPYIENDFGGYSFKECLEGKHRLVATHIPYTSLPSSVVDILNSGSCKIVYIYRDPKDVVVSLWHYLNKIFSSGIPFELFFEMFCQGKVIYGPYWSHLLGYLEVCKEQHPEAILFLKYEDLKSSTEDNVKRLAEFLGCPFSREEEEAGEMGKIIQLCSFENLRKLEVNKTGTHQNVRLPQVSQKNKNLFRMGKVGEWKNMLTPEMERRMNLIFEEKLKGSGISFSKDVES